MNPLATYAEWLEEGQLRVSGTIDILNRKDTHLYIQPDLFPEQRLFVNLSDWTLDMLAAVKVGARVRVDLAPQPLRPGRKPVAHNLHFLPKDSAPHGGVKGV